VHLDDYLTHLRRQHAEFCELRLAKVRALFATYDVDRNGVLSRAEFDAMLGELLPDASGEQVDGLWSRCVSASDAAEKSADQTAHKAAADTATIDVVSLGDAILHLESPQRPQQSIRPLRPAPSTREEVRAPQSLDTPAAFGQAVQLWDAVKDAADDVRLDEYLISIRTVVRLQAALRGLAARARRRARKRERMAKMAARPLGAADLS